MKSVLKSAFFWQFLVFLISLISTYFLWYSHDETFNNLSVEVLWQAQNNPLNLFQFLLNPFVNAGDIWVVLFLALIHATTAYFFVSTGILLGLGYRTLFFLFLILNFGNEFNDFRLSLLPSLAFSLLWLIALNVYLRFCENRLVLAFSLWCLIMWLAGFFSLNAVAWSLFFPPLLLWSRVINVGLLSFKKRLKVLGIYYGLIFLSFALIPELRTAALDLFTITAYRFSNPPEQIVIFGDSNAIFIAFTLAVVRTLQNGGILLLGTLFLAYKAKSFGVHSVLSKKNRIFLTSTLIFALLMLSILILYRGQLPDIPNFLPIIFIALWSAANGMYFFLQRWHNQKIKEEIKLVITWTAIAVALATLMQFGPSNNYLKEAGLWAKSQDLVIYSNNPSLLYYSGQSPKANNPYFLDFEDADLMEQGDYYALKIGRHMTKPDNLDKFKEIKSFKNRHGDRLVILQLQT